MERKTEYTAQYYELLAQETYSSATVCAALFQSLFNPRSVVDVGCGTGVWGKALMNRGVVDVIGIDGPFEGRGSNPLIPRERFLVRDLELPFILDRTFDLVLCLEVAEHLAESSAEDFVASLTRLGNTIVFSAAVPGQGGDHHVNEQWPDYWTSLFQKQRFDVLDCLRPILWRNNDVQWWYRQNMLVYVADSTVPLVDDLVERGRNFSREAPSLIHPELYERERARLKAGPSGREAIRGLSRAAVRRLSILAGRKR